MTSLEECYQAAHCIGYMDNVKGDHTGRAWSCEPRPAPEKYRSPAVAVDRVVAWNLKFRERVTHESSIHLVDAAGWVREP
jgi:hypothetical protein